MDHLNETLAWAAYGNSYEKIGFLKAFFNCLGEEELGHVKKIAHRTKSKSASKARSWTGPTIQEVKNRIYEPALQFRTHPCIQNDPQGPVKTPVVPNSSEPTVKTPALGESEPTRNKEVRDRWWKDRRKESYVAFDVEQVNLIGVRGVDREKAGIVAVVNSKKEPIYHTTVKHKPYSFETTTIGAKIAGITDPFQLVNGKEPEVVTKEMNEVLKEKFSIMVGAEKDYRLVGLKISDHQFFDLQSFYRRPHPTDDYITEPMSLRDMVFYHFRTDCQPPNRPHDALDDAIWTFRVFEEGYCKDTGPYHNFLNSKGEFDPDFSAVPNLKKKQKQGLKYCSFKKDFVPLSCNCVTCKI